MAAEKLISRAEQKKEDCWALEDLYKKEEEWEEEEAPVEIKKMAMPVWTASQLADKAKREGDAPDIVRDSITKVTFFDYSDILGGDTEESEEE